MIKKLNQSLINLLKAGEIVERPSSVLKELIENALDAGANEIDIKLEYGGTTCIDIRDNASGIDIIDAALVLDRYATSKIDSHEQLDHIHSYGFRGEALASIAEISDMLIQTKTINNPVGTAIRLGDIQPCSVAFDHGTHVLVQNIFAHVPARRKYLKSPQTEYKYCLDLFISYALIHPIKRNFSHNNKLIYTFDPSMSLSDKIGHIYKSERKDNTNTLEHTNDYFTMTSLTGNAQIRLSSPSYMHFFVNQRPVQDKIIKKAVLEAYKSQFAPREYPLVVIDLRIDPKYVDVNVHPRKIEVKFLDPGIIYNQINNAFQKQLGEQKIQYSSIQSLHKIGGDNIPKIPDKKTFAWASKNHSTRHISQDNLSQSTEQKGETGHIKQAIHTSYTQGDLRTNNTQGEKTAHGLHIIGQMRNMYIVCYDQDAMYYIDQHALAEKISYEKLQAGLNDIDQRQIHMQQTPLLTPIPIKISQYHIVSNISNTLQDLGFSIEQLNETTFVVYAIPKIIIEYVQDIDKLIDRLLTAEEISIHVILDTVFALKACKTSIKAGEKLNSLQMKQLIEDGYTHIPGMFACQHGRPFFFQFPKSDMDKLFARI